MIRQTNMRDREDLGTARVSRAGFGVAPKRTSITSHFAFRLPRQRKVRDREDALASTRHACGPQP
jgi:hypothetical protein